MLLVRNRAFHASGSALEGSGAIFNGRLVSFHQLVVSNRALRLSAFQASEKADIRSRYHLGDRVAIAPFKPFGDWFRGMMQTSDRSPVKDASR